MKDRVAVLIRREDALLLIHRIKEGQEYYVIPGGGVEEGESIQDAARREMREEVSLDLEVGPILWQENNQGRLETYLKAASVSGEVLLDGPERQRQSDANQYHPTWVRFSDLEAINLRPQTARKKIIDLVQHDQL